MRIFALFKAKKWFERRIQSAQKNKKITIITILILISGCFFYNQLVSIFPHCYAENYQISGYLKHEKEWFNLLKKENSKISNSEKNNTIFTFTNNLDSIKLANEKDNFVESQLYQLVGNAPIREMIPYICDFDNQVGAFIVGIAKKESDWGRHAPSLSGKTCYNYWGYKGRGSRGTSMGYACFGNAKEAVKTVGKRIENLISKNINDPQKFLVWKCGSSCAGHDPAGVKKWISDVSLYYGKVMKIQNS